MRLQDVFNLETLLKYCSIKLNWPIEEDWFDDVEDLFFDFTAADLGIKDDEFARIRSLKQLRPLVDNQPWGIFAVDFSGERLEVSALRRIIRSLVPSRNNTEFKTWNYDQLLFLCFWGAPEFPTIGFVALENNEKTLPILKVLYCAPRYEDRVHLESFESRISVLTWPKDIRDNESWVNNWGRFYAPARGQIIRDTVSLTEVLASTALNISNTLKNAFDVENESGFVHQLYYRFNSALKIDLSQQNFIDMYAQTIVYGLFSARCMCPEVTPFTIEASIKCVPETNPLLKELLFEYSSPNGTMRYDEFNIRDLVDALNRTDMASILLNFNRQTGYGKEDPVVYFYEKFLDLYEHEEKKRRGVYYTPTPAVNFIVRAISYILKMEFGCEAGFLDKKVSILDPATGTGTFLRSVILASHTEFRKRNGTRGWNEFVSDNLLARLFGFEFMMAPYAVAHMKLAMTLKDTGYSFPPDHRLQVYLANSLETGELLGSSEESNDPLIKESTSASVVRNSKINVILGNPPYRTDSVNKGEWIMQLMEDYKHEPGQDIRLQERNPKVINDDYVKFIRFAEEVIAKDENAIIAYVVPHSFTENLTFRGMRWNLLHSFDRLYIFDLHGNVMSREDTGAGERDENIFDIQQGICICLFIRNSGEGERLAKIYYSDLFGSREKKYHFLSTTQFENMQWVEVTPTEPYYFFKPKNLDQADSYDNGIQLSELFPSFLGGIKTHSDETLVSDLPFDTGYDQYYDYRPFDIKHINYDLTKVERPRYEIMKHFIGRDNIGIVIDRQVVTDNWSHIQVVKNMIDNRLHYSHKGIPVLCPMLLYDDSGASSPNIALDKLQQFSMNLVEEFSSCLTDEPGKFDILDIFDYCYGILHSSAYRTKYAELLSIDFPKVPVPVDSEMFHRVTSIGSHLRQLHLFEIPIENSLGIELVGVGDNVVARFRYANERAYINATQYFSNVREDLWDFCFAGYHGLQKWLKDRRQKVLSADDIQHIINVFNVFDLTETDMSEMDVILEAYGIV